MSVKTIFKTLLGTIFLMVTISVLIELFNVNISGMQIRQMTKMAAKQSCELFTQETYKINTSASGARSVSDVKNCDGTTYVTGDFYGYRTGESDSSYAYNVWHSIYGADAFKNFCTSSGRYGGASNGSAVRLAKKDSSSTYSSMQEMYPDLELFYKVMNGTLTSVSTPVWSASDVDIKKYNDYMKAQTMEATMFTPVNIGVPYMDEEVVNKMFRWHLAQILSNCNSDLIQKDDDNQYFVNYKGFRCYVQKARIYSYQYSSFNLSVDSEKDAFKDLTGMSADSLGRGSDKTENNIVTVVGINYEIPVSYKGLTPIKRVFNYIWDLEVGGFNGATPPDPIHQDWNIESLSSVTTARDATGHVTGTPTAITWLQAGGRKKATGETGMSETNSGALPSVGHLTYTLIR